MTQLSFSSFDSSLLVRDAQGRYLPASVDQILDAARQVIDQKIQRGMSFTSPTLVKEYLCAKLAGFEHEVFAVLFLDSQHRLIEYSEMFRGTIDSASVYPRGGQGSPEAQCGGGDILTQSPQRKFRAESRR